MFYLKLLFSATREKPYNPPIVFLIKNFLILCYFLYSELKAIQIEYFRNYKLNFYIQGSLR